MKFPILYKKTSTGAIQFWDISVEDRCNRAGGYPGIISTYGQLDTDSPQTTVDAIRKGKNTGKINETTALQQAEAEALSKWQKQKKKGYVESIESAQADEIDKLIEGGIVPMLAQKFADHAHKLIYPAYIQPKLDGIRCIAIVDNGKCTLWSRTRKQITSMPHIVAQIEALTVASPFILDGELYNHAFRSNFEHIVSMVRQEEPDQKHTDVEYHIYDTVDYKSYFKNRFGWWQRVWDTVAPQATHIKLVPTIEVEQESQVMDIFDNFRKEGFEGAMMRNAHSMYENKRSYGLQKVKEFDDGEFEIIGIDEGRGKLQGHVGAFVCRTADGKEFLAKMSGDTGRLKEYFENHSLWRGKQLTVKYQGLTGAAHVPRFPVGVVIRDYE